ncbi:MAG TPA: hypothetical protein VLT59_09065 [Steroidobacteraceae bacterium]|nr:hypothetical protein [Steroidobacteraceae bacterium]
MSDTDSTADHDRSRRGRFELVFAAACLGFGLLVLPALVYWVGVRILGPYSDGGLGAFYAGLFADLVSASGRAWLLVAGPYVALMLLRFVLFGFSGRRRAADRSSRRPASQGSGSTA